MESVELTDRLYLLRFGVGQAYLWVDSDGLTVIDTGEAGGATHIASAIRALGRRPQDLRSVVLTHGHADHCGSAADLAAWGAQVLVHRLDAPLVRGEAATPSPVLSAWQRALYDRILPSVPPARASRVDRELEHGDWLDFGGGAKVIAASGHTEGSVAFFLPHHRVLFTGDAVAGREGAAMLGVFNTDPEQARETLRRLAALDVEIACFGHGTPITTRASDALRAATAHRS